MAKGTESSVEVGQQFGGEISGACRGEVGVEGERDP